MKYLKIKAYKITKLIIELELYRLMLKYCIKNHFLPFWTRQLAVLELSYLPLQSSQVHFKARCFLSNQARSIITFFKLNRMRFKVSLASGLVTGVTKSEW